MILLSSPAANGRKNDFIHTLPCSFTTVHSQTAAPNYTPPPHPTQRQTGQSTTSVTNMDTATASPAASEKRKKPSPSSSSSSTSSSSLARSQSKKGSDPPPPPPPPNPFIHLPEVCSVHTLTHLRPSDVCKLGRASRELQELCASDVVWEPLYLRQCRLLEKEKERDKYEISAMFEDDLSEEEVEDGYKYHALTVVSARLMHTWLKLNSRLDYESVCCASVFAFDYIQLNIHTNTQIHISTPQLKEVLWERKYEVGDWSDEAEWEELDMLYDKVETILPRKIEKTGKRMDALDASLAHMASSTS